MIDRPLRIGRLAHEAVTRAGRGRVVSVFARAVSILLDDGGLVALLAADGPLHPWAIAPVSGMSSLRVGMDAGTDAQTLRAGPLAIPLAQARVVELTIGTRPTKRPSGVTIAILEAMVENRRLGDSSADAWAEERIEGALGAFSADGEVRALAGLVGLGPGLTPSGDDMLLGVLAGLDLASAFAERAGDIRRRLAAALGHDLEQRTSRMSAQMLRAAVGGRYPEPVVELGQALSEQEALLDEVRRAAAGVQAIGHCSGQEMLRGFVRAVAWAADLEVSRGHGGLRPNTATAEARDHLTARPSAR